MVVNSSETAAARLRKRNPEPNSYPGICVQAGWTAAVKRCLSATVICCFNDHLPCYAVTMPKIACRAAQQKGLSGIRNSSPNLPRICRAVAVRPVNQSVRAPGHIGA